MLDAFSSEDDKVPPQSGAARQDIDQTQPQIALVGSPNVGKSVMFSNLTGTYVTVSNYPGTTVEVTRGTGTIDGEECEIVDTPGMYSLLPLSEEEAVARRILLQEKTSAVVHVVDAKNVERMLPLTFQLIEAGFPVVLALNMMDEAHERGLDINVEALEQELGIPVCPTVSTTGEGVDELRHAIAHVEDAAAPPAYRYSPIQGIPVEERISELTDLLHETYRVSKRCVALLLLQGDDEMRERVRECESETGEEINHILTDIEGTTSRPLDYYLTVQRKKWAQAVCQQSVHQHPSDSESFSDRLSRILVRPITGVPILLAVLYFALYRFVGVFGAGTVVDYLEGTVFELWVNPHMDSFVKWIIPWQTYQDLFIGEFGILSLGFRYAIAIILPIVTFFFLVFSIIEDTGYLPRLALLLDRLFKKIGLSGRAVIPMVLGLGCDTMATMVTRTLSSKRERFIAVLLLSVAVPCSAQIGVIMGLLSPVPGAVFLWAAVMLTIYVLVGSVAARLIPGRAEPFYVEIPPLRLPKLSNILVKTFARLKWYLMEVIPLFVLASLFIWLGRLTGVFSVVISILEYPVHWINLPPRAATAFLLGFFRRDYGVAGLYDLEKAGALTATQLVVAAVALTLFLPCIAQFLMTVKERGLKYGIAVSVTVLVIAFGTAYALSHIMLAVQALI